MTLEEPQSQKRAREQLERANPQAVGDSQATGALTNPLSGYEPQPVSWLWPGHIPLGKLTLIGGDPGLGKSFLTIDLAARTTTGSTWPDGSPGIDPAPVVLASAEDDPADTIRPRFDAAGGAPERAHLLTGIEDLDSNGRLITRPPSLETDIPVIEAEVARTGARLLVIDPITAYLGGTDSHKNAEVRTLLASLAGLAHRQGPAVLGITHLNKGQGKALYRAMGSLAFVAAARAVWAVTADEGDGDRRLLVPIKNNLGQDRQGRAFRLEAVPEITDAGGLDYQGVAVRWEEEAIDLTADEALTPSEPEERTKQDDAADWLREELANGPRAVKELQSEAREAGISWDAAKRAKARLGVRAEKQGLGGWVWLFPEEGNPKGAGPGAHTPAPFHSSQEDAASEGEGNPEEAEGCKSAETGGRDLLRIG